MTMTTITKEANHHHHHHHNDDDVAMDIIPPSSTSGGDIASSASMKKMTLARTASVTSMTLMTSSTTATMKDLSTMVADSTPPRDVVYTFAAIIVAPMVLPILLAMVPMQSMEDGLFKNYTWWYQAVVDFLVYAVFIVGTMALFVGVSPISTQLYRQYMFTFCIYGLPHIGMFIGTAELIAWPIPFSIYLVCGPLYLVAILFNYATLVKSHINTTTNDTTTGTGTGTTTSKQQQHQDQDEEMADDLNMRAKMMVMQFFVQAILFGLFVGYRALFSIQPAPVQTVMVVAFFVLEAVGARAITSLVQRCQFPGTDYVLATELSYGVVASLFKALLFPSISDLWMFALLVTLDALPTVRDVYLTSTAYIRRRGRTTSLDNIATIGGGGGGGGGPFAASSSVESTTMGAAMADEDARVKEIVTSALFSHIAKVLAPAYFVIIISMFWELNRHAVFMFDDIGRTAYLRSLTFAIVDVGVQAAMLALYVALLRMRRLSAVKIVTVHMSNHLNLWFYFLQTSCYMVLVMFILIRHWGCDFTFKFEWM